MVFSTGSTAVGGTMPVIVNTAEPETGRLTKVSMLPVPAGTRQVPPLSPMHVQVKAPCGVGSASVTCTPGASLGPPLVTRAV